MALSLSRARSVDWRMVLVGDLFKFEEVERDLAGFRTIDGLSVLAPFH